MCKMYFIQLLTVYLKLKIELNQVTVKEPEHLRDVASRLMVTSYSLHCSSFLGVTFRILNIELVKPKKELQ